MNLLTAAVGGGIFIALATVLGYVFKHRRGSPEQRTAEATQWAAIAARAKGLDERVDQRLNELEQRDVTTRRELADLRDKTDRSDREIKWMRGVVIAAVKPIVDWLDSGATPPPPHVPGALRTLVADAEEHQADPSTP